MGSLERTKEAQVEKVSEQEVEVEAAWWPSNAEQLAHGAAYGKYNPAQLHAWGYEPLEVIIPVNLKTGACVVAVAPRECSPEETAALLKVHGRLRRSVVAFRGSTDGVDWKNDALVQGIGRFTLAAHQDDIQAAVARFASRSLDGRVDLVGHSLGGAIAQLTAALGGPVGRTVTFQAPGIGAEAAAQTPDYVETSHYRARNDVVPLAGGAHAEGKTRVFDREGTDTVASHGDHILTSLNEARGDAGVQGLYDTGALDGFSYEGTNLEAGVDESWSTRGLVDIGGQVPDWTGDGEVDGVERLYDGARTTTAEAGRMTLGAGMLVEDEVHDYFAETPLQALGGMGLVLGVLPAAGAVALGVAAGQTPSGADVLTNGLAAQLSSGGANDIDMSQMMLTISVRDQINAAKREGRSQEEILEIVNSSDLKPDLKETLRRDLRPKGER